MTRLVIASAARFETAILAEALREKGIEFTWIETGVGLTNAVAVASRTRDLVAGRDVIFCGTGGIVPRLSDDVAVSYPEVYSVSSVALNPFDVRSGDAYLLTDFEPPIKFENTLKDVDPTCAAVCGLGITKADEKSLGSREPSLLLETIELYGVAKCWREISSTFTPVLCSTNVTGPNAHSQWKQNFSRAARMTAEFVMARLIG